MTILLRRLFIVVLAGLALAACETPVAVQRLPEITFAHLPKIGLNVASVEIVSEYQAPLQAPNVEHLMKTPPEKALKRWAADRLVAKGASNTARFTVNDAKVVQEALPVKEGVKGFFTTDQSVRYSATAEGTLEIFDANGFRLAFANARVSRSRTLAEDASINERERMWFDLVEALSTDFDQEMERNIKAHAGGYVM